MTQYDAEGSKQAGVRGEKTARRRERIINASLAVFSDGGYAAYSMRRVAVEADVMLNTVQHHFGDLKSLLLATIEAQLSMYSQRYEAMAADEDLEPTERLEAALDDAFSEIRRPEAIRFFMELWTLAARDSDVAEQVRDLYEHFTVLVGTIIKSINPSLTASEVNILATMIVSWCEGIAITQQFRSKSSPPISALAVKVKASFFAIVENFNSQRSQKTRR